MMEMELRLPERTACTVTYDGVALWVKTLNVFERDEAAAAAEVWAATQVRPFRDRQGEGYAFLAERFGATEVDVQCRLVAEAGLYDGTLSALAAQRFPGDGAEAIAQREALLISEYRRLLAEAEGFSRAERLDRCIAVAIARRERNARGFRLVCETLWRAVRPDGARLRHHWADAGVVMELSDPDRDWFWQLYERLQLPMAAVPTSAAVSPE